MKPFDLTKSYLLSQRYALTLYVLIVISTTAISILSPYIIGDFLDTLIEGGNLGVIIRFSAIFGVLSLLRVVKGYITSIMYIKMQTQMSYNLNRDVIEHIQGLSLSYINQNNSAYLSQRASSDSVSLIAYSIGILQNMITNVIMLVVPFIVMLHMNWLVAVLMMGFIAVYAIFYHVFKKPLYNASLSFRETQAKFFVKMFEQLKHIQLIKTNSLQKEMIQRANNGFVDYKDATIHNQKVNSLYSGLEGTISTLAQIVLFVIGGIQILVGNFSIGMFTIFTSYFGMMLSASRYFYGLGVHYQNTMVSYDRIKDILNRKLENYGRKIIEDISKIEVRSLNFSYKVQDDMQTQNIWDAQDTHNTQDTYFNQTKEIIANFDATFTKGNIYAITGANGMGKSTLVSLIIGMYTNEYRGSIAYDGINIRDIDMIATRKNLIGFAEQEPFLINDSISYNVGLARDTKSLCTIKKYAKILKLDDFISEHTLEYKINEKNTNISGGEKQKIAILRTLCKNPVVMIFDEPTSALDSNTALEFMDYLQAIKKNKIILIITHNRDIIKRSDNEVMVCAKQKSDLE